MGCLFSGTFSIIGFIVGLVTGGLPGAMGGLLIGTILDVLIRTKSRKYTHHYKTYDFTEHELYLAAYVAKADQNRLLRSEMTYVQEYFRKRVGSQQLGTLMLRFRDILNSDVNIHVVCADLNKYASINEKLVILHFLFGFSQADGNMGDAEVNAIAEIAQLMGVNRSAFEAVKSMFTGSYGYGAYGDFGQRGYGGSANGGYRTPTVSSSDYTILEISPDATDEEVKKAYRAAAKKHHPDKVSHLGEEVRKTAEDKFAKVNEAYERIKKARGIN